MRLIPQQRRQMVRMVREGVKKKVAAKIFGVSSGPRASTPAIIYWVPSFTEMSTKVKAMAMIIPNIVKPVLIFLRPKFFNAKVVSLKRAPIISK